MFRLKLIITQVVSVLAIALAGFPLISVGQHYNHDQIGRLSSVVYPSGDGVRYEYDTRDNLVRIGTFLAPTPPTDVSITRLPENKAQLTWAHPINDRVEIIGFFIEAANIGSADWQPLQLDPPIGPTERTATVYLSDGEQDFRIVAIEGFTRSAPSSTVRLAAQEALLVTTLVDENDHQLGRGEGDSLREVIEAAAPGDRIEFAIEPGDQTFLPLDIGFLPPPAVGLLPLPPAAPPFSTILLRAIELVIDKDLTIDASGVPGGITIDAFHECRVLRIIGDVKVTLKDLTILNGFADDGGGIFSDQAELELQNCHLVGNEAVYGGGLFSLEGRVTMLEGSVSDNVATGNGGGIFLIDSELTVRFGEVSGNAAGFWGGGVINNGGTVTIENSSLYNNHADRAGGGLFNSDGVMLVVNSTLSGNSSGTNEGGAAVNPFFDPDRDATMTLRHCTIAGNVGGGVLNESPSVLVLDNTILANNTKLNAPLDMEGDFTAIGANVVRAQIGGTRLSGPAPLTSDPLLDDLASYGASSTMPPLVGSPVIDAGVVTANTPSTDQESSSRPYGPAPDIGAVESRLSADTDLKWLTTTAGTILPTFRSKRLDYSVTVSSSVTLAAVRPAANVFGQTIDVRINGGAWATVDSKDSSADLPLFPGENPIQVRVTAENGSTTKTYTLKVIRGAREETNTELTSLSLSAGALSPAFQPATVDYDTFAANEVTGTTVTATPAEKGATMAVRSNYGPFVPLVSGVASAPLVLKVGDNAIDVKITSKDGGTSLTYTVVVSRAAPDSSNADLASLSTDVGSLSPPFSRGRSVYRITTDEKTAASVTASVAQSGATMKLSVNGGSATTLNSGEASTSFGLAEGENIIRIIVTAVDGTTVHPYTLIITRIIEGVAVASADSQDAASQDASISGDGRFGAFSSSDSSLLVGDTNNAADIFVYDRMEDTLERISVDNNGIEGNDDSSRPSISADGRYVAFQSEATNLVPNDTNGDTERSRGSDIFVHDRIANATERISLTDSGGEANQASESPSISGDGRYVAFVSGANNLVTGYANGEFNVYVYDREATDPAEAITGISVPFGNYAANLNSLNPAISSDGSYVAFELSVDKSVDSTPGYQYRDIWLYNRATTGVERITGTEIGPSADTTDSRAPSISADGRFIAFESNLESLDFYDTNLAVDVFLYDRMDKSIRRVSSKAAQGGEDYMQSRNPSISGDGRYVAFESQASNLVDDDTNGSADIFLKDLQTGEIVRLSETLVGAEGNADSLLPSVSFDGRSVAYQTDATNLKANNTNDSTDVIVAFIKALNPSSLADLASLTTGSGRFAAMESPASAGVWSRI
ncbi:MAG: cadherin-like beta sandwich domain-containing protein [Opitutaceae bacterium]